MHNSFLRRSMEYVPPSNKKPVQLVKHLHKVPAGKRVWPAIGDLKVDGVYAYGLATEQDQRIFSRTGQEYTSLKRLSFWLADIRKHLEYDCVLIFEVYTPDWPVNRISGACRDTKKQYEEAIGLVHDIIPYDDFVAGICRTPYIERKRNLRDLFSMNYFPAFEMSEGFHIRDEEHAQHLAETYINAGEEGIIGRDPKGIWIAGKKNADLWKIKQELSYDLEVVDVLEGDGKYKGTTGKIVCKFRKFGKKSGEACFVTCSGMTDPQRHEWWSNPDRIVGKIVKVDAMTFTEYGVLREPRFKEIREDKFEADF